jgi:hypothetical protein
MTHTDADDRCKYLVLFLQAATVVAIASFLLREIVDPDAWWQVAIGRDILEHLSVPRSDHFAAAALGRSYHDSHWLFQVLAAGADHLGGMRGVELLMAALWGATLLCSYSAIRQWLSPAAGCVLVFVVAMACNDRFTPRPDIITCFMIAFFYLRLQAGKYSTVPQLALLALFQVAWSNSHGLFIIGPFLAGCYLIEALARRLRGEEAEVFSQARLMIVLLLASLRSPFGLDGWRYAFLLMKEVGPASPAVLKTVAELSPTFGAVSRSYPAFWCYLALLMAVVLSTIDILRQQQVPYARLLIVAILFAASLTGRRNIPLFALTAAPLIAENLRRSSWQPSCPGAVKGGLAFAMLTLSYFPMSGRYYELFDYYPQRFGIGVAPRYFPLALPGFLHRLRFSGQLYNPNHLGGFFLYHGFPPLTDGRWEVYDEKVLDRILAAPYDRDTWEWLVATYDIRGVVLDHGEQETTVLFPRLSNDKRFSWVYSSDSFSFWLRNDKPR